MSNHHYEKWITKTASGLLLIGGGIFFMYYSIANLKFKDHWELFGIICSVAVAFGAYLLSTAAVNKVKGDMIKKQKMKQMSN